ncbi:MAG: flagellar export chaperone FliS [Nitrospirae bacterium]|nr:flagellar export chaperone FliS [Nitrospirota bacterium]
MTNGYGTANGSLGAYQNVDVRTAAPEQLLLMLYSGAIKFTTQAREYMIAGRKADKAERLSRVCRIIEALQTSLDVETGGEVAENLSRLYYYMMLQLTKANIHNDHAILDEVIGLLATLNEGWTAAVNSCRAVNGQAANAEAGKGKAEPVPMRQPLVVAA